ncbi:crotonobetainyl-CoA:carnitine CoA-transferase [Clostridium botulinum]|uniref:Crotonobetainyl-CoA--carnitine CoA-transferase n=1 Tax=Clostridium botulinum TaxID=1491 RepID=A0A6B4N2G8_CLOBO|nr:crotonobetainyl-CoA--carnitine CoA-transferase [Clostridium botulinum]ACD52281.1 CalS11 [Clostridium botulinum E3 str. Alaska E43]AJF28817.1 crotonobetainyl-CoA:carnitine CoA-transferase [Clostridium botulinum]AJF31878.1 crotonobetainyl-CoA:carnitine CoA-transferase [Clostridium botulinum]EES50715.1 CalS11 [Clostridium botulinum E1 str. 'BoNT E Beluga']MBN1070267.1 crotonobetainyl-CoA--carnitine CoA-transferase [Clostridium botulinum]
MNIKVDSNSNDNEKVKRSEFIDLFKLCPIPESEVLNNLGLFINRQSLSRILFMQELYEKIINTHGIITEFGVRWGQNLSLFQSFRGMYEPFNYNRKIVGFDTFTGFVSIDEKDGNADVITEGAYSVTENYENYLEKILDYQEGESPISHIKKYELVKGDATKTIHEYLKNNPETIIALAYFDFDIYKPTKECLEAIKGHLTKGSVIGFDELNYHNFPGETLALKEVFGLDKYKIQRSILSPLQSYIVIE